MAQAPDQLTRRPICPICKTVQLTDEELGRDSDPMKRRCWYCLAESLIGIGEEAAIPEPAVYGRPMSKQEGIEQARSRNQKLLRGSPTDIIAAITNAAPENAAVDMQTIAGSKPVLTSGGNSPIQMSDTQRAEFVAKFGVDPLPKSNPYEIVVYGATEDTYLKFGCPIPIELAEQRELQRIMAGVLEIFGKFLKYGAQFAGALIELQSLASEMFLGGRR